MVNQAGNQKDPVCGMDVNTKQSKYKLNYHDKQFSFCCQQCLNKFKQNPDQYA